MHFSLFVYLLILASYGLLIIRMGKSIKENPPMDLEVNSAFNGISIIIPFRNEAQRILPGLKSLSELSYDPHKIEIIFIDDHSTDSTSTVFDQFNKKSFKVLLNKGKGKKEALITGIENASFSWILTSDADCTFDREWLNTCNKLLIEQPADLYVLPVNIEDGQVFHSKFQHYESLGSLGMNIAFYLKRKEVILASAANMLFKKEDFQQLNPYDQNIHIASGDDMFLLEVYKKAHKKICLAYQPELWVSSKAEGSWRQLIDQRIRWAKKMRHLAFSRASWIGMYLLIIQLALWGILLSSLSHIAYLLLFILVILLKTFLDLNFIKSVGKIKAIRPHGAYMIMIEFVYMIMVPLLAIAGIFRTVVWKDRKIRS